MCLWRPLASDHVTCSSMSLSVGRYWRCLPCGPWVGGVSPLLHTPPLPARPPGSDMRLFGVNAPGGCTSFSGVPRGDDDLRLVPPLSCSACVPMVTRRRPGEGVLLRRACARLCSDDDLRLSSGGSVSGGGGIVTGEVEGEENMVLCSVTVVSACC